MKKKLFLTNGNLSQQLLCKFKSNVSEWNQKQGQHWLSKPAAESSFLEKIICRVPFPPVSLCSWWDQPLLGTLVVVALQLPYERKSGGRKGRVGGERRGRDESKHHQRDRMTFLRAQGLLITGGLGLMHRDGEMMKWNTNETFYSTAKSDWVISLLSNKIKCISI